jgi:hypothetical protein
MATTSTATLQITLTGDVTLGPQNFSATQNTSSPAQTQIASLSSGNNSITIPSTATRMTITNKAGGVALTLKGINGDTGITLGQSDWDSFSLSSPPPATVVINAGSSTTVRILFS